jgi:hypothetical protein
MDTTKTILLLPYHDKKLQTIDEYQIYVNKICEEFLASYFDQKQYIHNVCIGKAPYLRVLIDPPTNWFYKQGYIQIQLSNIYKQIYPPYTKLSDEELAKWEKEQQRMKDEQNLTLQKNVDEALKRTKKDKE